MVILEVTQPQRKLQIGVNTAPKAAAANSMPEVSVGEISEASKKSTSEVDIDVTVAV